MKNDNNNMELDQLLATIEHAGRDSRRQRELDAMINNLAAAEATKRHSFLWWSSRVAAVACVTFFVTTVIRIWFSHTGTAGSSAPIVAEMTEKEAPSAIIENTATVPTVVAPARMNRTTRHYAAKLEKNESVATEVILAEKTTEETTTANDTDEKPDYIIEDDFAPDTELIAYNEEPEHIETPESVVNQPVVSEPATPQRRKILGGFLRRSEPSRMEGTSLALLQF